MGFGPMFPVGGVSSGQLASAVSGYSFAALEQLDRRVSQARIQLLMDELIGNTVVVLVDHHMVVDVDRRSGPSGHFKRDGRQGFELVFLVSFEPAIA